MLKKLSSLLSPAGQQELRRWKCRADMKAGRFRPRDPEFDLLPELVGQGDWVLDIGANVGYYALKLSELVGASGRVFAFEPISRTVEVLSHNSRYAVHDNITIIQAAAWDQPGILSFIVDLAPSGLPDYFTARSTSEGGNFSAFATTIDSLALPHRVSLAKIDVEGAERLVLRGMEALLRRDQPVLIVEGHESSLADYLAGFGYVMMPRKPPSANLLFLPQHALSRAPANLD